MIWEHDLLQTLQNFDAMKAECAQQNLGNYRQQQKNSLKRHSMNIQQVYKETKQMA
jgi:hypothetical protein